jgi:hypothetical protein
VDPLLCGVTAVGKYLLWDVCRERLPVLQLISTKDPRLKQIRLFWKERGSCSTDMPYHQMPPMLTGALEQCQLNKTKVTLLAGLPEDFKKQCYIGRSQVPVPAAWVNKLMPDIFTLREQLRTQAQASSKRDLDYSALALTDTLILLAEAVFQGMPLRIRSTAPATPCCSCPQSGSWSPPSSGASSPPRW